MAKVLLRDDRLTVGRFSLQFQRTLRVPADGRTYPLPPALSSFPIFRSRDYPKAAPDTDYFIPLYQYEALWLRFEGAEWKPNAVQVGSGGVNVLTGDPYPSRLRKRPQNYMVCPGQPWLDGFKTGHGVVRQFVAAPLGGGMTAAEQLGFGGGPALQVRVVEPSAGVFPDRPPKGFASVLLYQEELPSQMGLAPGGAIEQMIYGDPYPLRTWNEKDSVGFTVAIVNSEKFRAITGTEPPPSPVSTAEYTRAGLPWFRYFDDEASDTRPAAKMESLRPIALEDQSVDPKVVRTIRRIRKNKP